MGGRGSKSGGGGSASSEKPISKMMTNVYYNSAKKNPSIDADFSWFKRDPKIERDIRTGKGDYINSIKTEKEARRVNDYLVARNALNDKKIVKLGSREALQKDQRLAHEKKRINNARTTISEKMKQFSKRPDPVDQTLQHRQTTTTYDRARKRRIKNFDAWFGTDRRLK